MNKRYKLNLQLFGDEEKKEPSPNPAEEKPVEEDKQLNPDEVIDIKKNYVKREELEKANQKYQELVEKVLDGKEISSPEEKRDEKPDIAALRKELFNPESNLSNLDYVSKTLQLRKAIMDDGGSDPFLPNGHDAKGQPVAITEDDVNAANKVAEALQNCIDVAKGDDGVFNVELTRIIQEVKLPHKSNKKFVR